MFVDDPLFWNVTLFTVLFIVGTMAVIGLYFGCRKLIDVLDGFVKVKMR